MNNALPLRGVRQHEFWSLVVKLGIEDNRRLLLIAEKEQHLRDLLQIDKRSDKAVLLWEISCKATSFLWWSRTFSFWCRNIIHSLWSHLPVFQIHNRQMHCTISVFPDWFNSWSRANVSYMIRVSQRLVMENSFSYWHILVLWSCHVSLRASWVEGKTVTLKRLCISVCFWYLVEHFC